MALAVRTNLPLKVNIALSEMRSKNTYINTTLSRAAVDWRSV